MKIGIEASRLVNKQATGVANYLREILKVWKNSQSSDEFYLFSNIEIDDKDFSDKTWHYIVLYHSNKASYYLELSRRIKELCLDVFWSPSFYLPPKINKTRYFVTIHDLASLKIKEINTLYARMKMYFVTKYSCKISERIIAISEATSKDIQELFGIPNNKISMIYNGCSTEMNNEYNIDRIRNDLKLLPKSYFLFIGTIEPRKNIITIVKAFNYHREKKGVLTNFG